MKVSRIISVGLKSTKINRFHSIFVPAFFRTYII